MYELNGCSSTPGKGRIFRLAIMTEIHTKSCPLVKRDSFFPEIRRSGRETGLSPQSGEGVIMAGTKHPIQWLAFLKDTVSSSGSEKATLKFS